MTTDQSPIVIGCAADEGFAMPLAVLVRSILNHLSPNRCISLYVLDLGLPEPLRERLIRSWPAERIGMHWLKVDPTSLKHLPVWGRMSFATYQRLLMGSILPQELNRIIWLDADAFACTDMAALWDTPLDGKVIGASQDLVVPFVGSLFGVEQHSQLGLAADAAHFNAGVMLVDLAAWRAKGVAERSFEYLARHAGHIWFWDQEALNVVLAGEWKLLDPRWNQIASVAGRWFFTPAHLDDKQYRQVVDSPFIVHWAGSIKPWKFRSLRRWHRAWFEVLDQTQWRGWRPPWTMSAIGLGLYDGIFRNLLYRCEPLLLKAQRRGAH